MPEWTVASYMIILPPNMVVLRGPVMVVPAFIPEWTLILTIILHLNVQVLVLVLVVTVFMPGWMMPVWAIVSIILNMEIMAPVSLALMYVINKMVSKKVQEFLTWKPMLVVLPPSIPI
jgi:hypothetical protein